jgi:hypothetical protein
MQGRCLKLGSSLQEFRADFADRDREPENNFNQSKKALSSRVHPAPAGFAASELTGFLLSKVHVIWILLIAPLGMHMSFPATIIILRNLVLNE